MPNHEEYLWYKEREICPICGHAKASPGKVTCDECLEKHRARDRERYKSADKSARNAYQKQRREKLKAAGICFRCGQKKAESGKVMCLECAAKYRRWNNVWHSKKSRHWKEAGECQWCSNKALPEKNYCQKHYVDLCERIAKGRETQKNNATCKRLNNAFWMEYKSGGSSCT